MLEEDGPRVTINRLIDCHGLTTIHSNGAPTDIQINPDTSEFIQTIIHECLHMVNWDWPHPKVYALEKQLCFYLSDRQLHNLLRRVFK